MEIRKIGASSLAELQIKRVAAYARVSVEKDAAEHSLESQISYYDDYIKGNPGWIFVGVYADDGISGTTSNRPEFQRMLEDARAGKIDIIITKSVTRFARNIVTLLEAVRELKLLGIDVIFEKESIHSLSNDGELMLSLLAMYAEEEARSASENKRWQIQKQFEQGRPTYARMCGYKWVNGQLVIIPEEAKIVRDVFDMYLSGMGTTAIARKLNESGTPSMCHAKWIPSVVAVMLRNEKYIGDLMLQKSYRPDFRTKRDVDNKGQWRRYYVEDAHEAIIDKETFNRVQIEIEARREKYHPSKPGTHSRETALFAGILKCGKCHKHFNFRNQRVTSSDGHIPLYVCKTYFELGVDHCDAKKIRESILIEKTKEVLGIDQETKLTRERILEQIASIESAADNRLRFHLKNGTVKIVDWKNPSRSQSWTPEMRQKARERALKQAVQKGVPNV